MAHVVATHSSCLANQTLSLRDNSPLLRVLASTLGARFCGDQSAPSIGVVLQHVFGESLQYCSICVSLDRKLLASLHNLIHSDAQLSITRNTSELEAAMIDRKPVWLREPHSLAVLEDFKGTGSLCMPMLWDANAELAASLLIASEKLPVALWEAWRVHSQAAQLVGVMLFGFEQHSCNIEEADSLLTNALLLATMTAPYIATWGASRLRAVARALDLQLAWAPLWDQYPREHTSSSQLQPLARGAAEEDTAWRQERAMGDTIEYSEASLRHPATETASSAIGISGSSLPRVSHPTPGAVVNTGEIMQAHTNAELTPEGATEVTIPSVQAGHDHGIPEAFDAHASTSCQVDGQQLYSAEQRDRDDDDPGQGTLPISIQPVLQEQGTEPAGLVLAPAPIATSSLDLQGAEQQAALEHEGAIAADQAQLCMSVLECPPQSMPTGTAADVHCSSAVACIAHDVSGAGTPGVTIDHDAGVRGPGMDSEELVPSQSDSAARQEIQPLAQCNGLRRRGRNGNKQEEMMTGYEDWEEEDGSGKERDKGEEAGLGTTDGRSALLDIGPFDFNELTLVYINPNTEAAYLQYRVNHAWQGPWGYRLGTLLHTLAMLYRLLHNYPYNLAAQSPFLATLAFVAAALSAVADLLSPQWPWAVGFSDRLQFLAGLLSSCVVQPLSIRLALRQLSADGHVLWRPSVILSIAVSMFVRPLYGMRVVWMMYMAPWIWQMTSVLLVPPLLGSMVNATEQDLDVALTSASVEQWLGFLLVLSLALGSVIAVLRLYERKSRGRFQAEYLQYAERERRSQRSGTQAAVPVV